LDYLYITSCGSIFKFLDYPVLRCIVTPSLAPACHPGGKNDVQEISKQIPCICGTNRKVFSSDGVIGIDGSPSCGVNTTLDIEKSFELTASIDVESVTVEQMNAIIRQGLTNGKGLFADALQKELKKRHVDIPYGAHDLIAEINGQTSSEGTLLSL